MTHERCGLNRSCACLISVSLLFSVPWPVFLVQMIAHYIGSRSPLIPFSRACSMCHLVVCFSDWLDFSTHFFFLISISLITLLFLLQDNFICHIVVDKYPCAFPLRTLAPWPRTSLPQVMSPTTTSSRRLMSNTPRSPPASSGPPMTSTTITPPSARRSLTRAEDKPITLNKKACRPVCRRHSFMIERGDPLFAHLVHRFRASKKLRDTTSKVNRLGLSWNDKESKFSLTVKQRFENTNSSPITTEEVCKNRVKLSSRNKKKFVVLIKETNDVDKINNFFMNSY